MLNTITNDIEGIHPGTDHDHGHACALSRDLEALIAWRFLRTQIPFVDRCKAHRLSDVEDGQIRGRHIKTNETLVDPLEGLMLRLPKHQCGGLYHALQVHTELRMEIETIIKQLRKLTWQLRHRVRRHLENEASVLTVNGLH